MDRWIFVWCSGSVFFRCPSLGDSPCWAGITMAGSLLSPGSTQLNFRCGNLVENFCYQDAARGIENLLLPDVVSLLVKKDILLSIAGSLPYPIIRIKKWWLINGSTALRGGLKNSSKIKRIYHIVCIYHNLICLATVTVINIQVKACAKKVDNNSLL